MSKRKEIAGAIIDKICRSLRKGTKHSDIAKLYRVSLRTISRIAAKKHGYHESEFEQLDFGF